MAIDPFAVQDPAALIAQEQKPKDGLFEKVFKSAFGKRKDGDDGEFAKESKKFRRKLTFGTKGEKASTILKRMLSARGTEGSPLSITQLARRLKKAKDGR